MGKVKIPDGLALKQAQYESLLGVWQDIKSQLQGASEVLQHYTLSEIDEAAMAMEIFGYQFVVRFVHNFKTGQAVYARAGEGNRAGEDLVAINFDAKGKLAEPYHAYTIKDFTSVNFYVLDSITSVSRLVK